MAARPYWLAACVVAFGIVWATQALKVPLFAQYAELGPGFVPMMIGLGLIVLGLILTFQIYQGESFEAQEVEDMDASAEASKPALIFASLGIGLPLLTMTPLGFPVTAAISYVFVARALGSHRYVLNVAIGLILGLVCWYGFTALGSRLGGLFPPLGV